MLTPFTVLLLPKWRGLCVAPAGVVSLGRRVLITISFISLYVMGEALAASGIPASVAMSPAVIALLVSGFTLAQGGEGVP